MRQDFLVSSCISHDDVCLEKLRIVFRFLYFTPILFRSLSVRFYQMMYFLCVIMSFFQKEHRISRSKGLSFILNHVWLSLPTLTYSGHKPLMTLFTAAGGI